MPETTKSAGAQTLAETIVTAHPRLLSRLRELVEVESPSEDKLAVDRANALVAGWAEAVGAKVRRHRQKQFGDVLELRFGPTRARATPTTARFSPAPAFWT